MNWQDRVCQTALVHSKIRNFFAHSRSCSHAYLKEENEAQAWCDYAVLFMDYGFVVEW